MLRGILLLWSLSSRICGRQWPRRLGPGDHGQAPRWLARLCPAGPASAHGPRCAAGAQTLPLGTQKARPVKRIAFFFIPTANPALRERSPRLVGHFCSRFHKVHNSGGTALLWGHHRSHPMHPIHSVCYPLVSSPAIPTLRSTTLNGTSQSKGPSVSAPQAGAGAVSA